MFRCESEIAFSGERLATVARADCNRFSSVLSYSLGIVIRHQQSAGSLPGGSVWWHVRAFGMARGPAKVP